MRRATPAQSTWCCWGALCRLTGTDRALWRKAVEASVPEKSLAINLAAFEQGYEEVLPA